MSIKKLESTDQVRAPRFTTNGGLLVKSKTIGTMLAYQLSTDDISSSGMLLSWDHNATIPFRENTLLELEIDPQGSWLGKPLYCMGKVARRFVADEESKTKFGISIVQMDGDCMNKWENCIQKIAILKSLDQAA